MNKVLIGRNGNQPFVIDAEGVSALHASLTVTADGLWILKDEDSTNGTFVRNPEGNFERIEVKRISPSTVVRLGDETVNGISFQASRLFKVDQDDYSAEFLRLKEYYVEYQQDKEKMRRKATLLKFVPLCISVACLILSLRFDSPFVMRILMFLPSAFTVFARDSGMNDKEMLAARYKKILVCPKCGKVLGEYEITKGQCAACKVHC